MTIADMVYRLSGGAANSDPNLSLGGIISATEIASQSVSGISSVTGVTAIFAAGNQEGVNGILAFTFATKTLTWTPPGQAAGAAVDVSVDGNYKLSDSSGWQVLHVTVVAASLPVSDQVDSAITITNVNNALFDDLSKSDTHYGHIDYRCFYVRNGHATDTILDVRVWVQNQFSGVDSMEIGLDLAGMGDGSTTGVADTVVNEETAPDPMVTFSSVSSYVTGLVIGDLAPGECHAVWVKRTVPADTTLTTLNDTGNIGIGGNI